MRLVAHIDYRLQLRLIPQIVSTIINAVVITIGTAVSHDAPHIVFVEVIKWCEKLYYLTFKSLR